MADEIYWVWLQQALGAGNAKAVSLAQKFGGAEALHRATVGQLSEAGGLTPRENAALLQKSLAASEEILRACAEKGYRVLTAGDDAYPRRLLDIFAPPAALYVWGDLPDTDGAAAIAVVGTRQITEYGYEAATRLSMGLAQNGVTVVSGLAVGVDGAAHRGALKGGGKTVAVIGCGPDVNYPKKHEELRRLISRNGAVVSEYPPGTRPDRAHFPLRNRIIAGLSLGTVVVEAGSRSGALITASLAAEMGRDVFAVPGSIFSPVSEGANRLIRDGAKPVCSVLDILEEYIGLYPQTITLNAPAKAEEARQMTFEEAEKDFGPPKKAPPSRRDKPAAAPRKRADAESASAAKAEPQGLTDTQLAVFRALSATPRLVDELALRLNLETRVVLAVMTTLEIEGLARPLPGRRYVRAG